MAKVTFITHDGEKTVEAEEGKKLLSIAENNGIEMRHSCGGNASCTTCMVEVKQNKDNLAPMTEGEKQMMLPEDGTTRLGCQARVQGDVTVELVM